MLETERLILRRWEARDLAPFAALNADPEVMRHFPKPLDAGRERRASSRGCEDRWREDGIGFAVAERKADGAFVGMVGLSRLRVRAAARGRSRSAGGWRGRTGGEGYATEAARGWLGHGLRRDGARGDRRLHGAGEPRLAGG